MPLGRVLRIDGHTAQLGTPQGVVGAMIGTVDATLGDLVAVADGQITEVVAKNRSKAPLDEQGWWRLQQVLPNISARSAMIGRVRRWFYDQGFLDVEMPTLVQSPSLEVHLSALETHANGERRYLATSPEYHMKRLLCAGMEKIFYLGRAYRDNERGHLHHPEFTILEWYRAGANCRAIQEDVKALVALVTGNEERPWQSISVKSALARWVPESQEEGDLVHQLVEFVEPRLAEMGAVFLYDYPAELASLARLNPLDPSLSQRFEAYVDGIELANGFGELTDAEEQRERFEKDRSKRRELALPEYPIDERFMSALETGMPPSAGIALGMDRLVMLALRATSLDQVTLFPPEHA